MIHIANLSLGGSGSDSDSAYRRAFEATVASGCFVVVAAGNENGNFVSGLATSAFVVSGSTVLGNISETAGSYAITIDINDITPYTDYPVTVAITDDRDLTDTATTIIRRVTAVTVYVAEISYELIFKNLRVYLTVRDLSGNAVSGAEVNFTLNRNGAPFPSYTGTTGSSGQLSARVGGAKKGIYTTTINSISKDGVINDDSLNTNDPGFVY